MSKVCHTCPLWMKLPVLDDKGNPLDEWKCGKVWDTILKFKLCQETLSVSKEVNELRNETKKSHDSNVAIGAIATHRATEAVRSVIGEVVSGKFVSPQEIAATSLPLIGNR